MLTPEMALVLYGVYILFAFGYRTLLHVRLTGASGFHGISGRAGSAEWLAGVGFVVALVVGIVAPVLAVLGIVERIGWLDRPALQIAGIVLFALGHFGTLAAQAAMGASWRIGVDASERTELVASGPFRYSRNPIFAAMGLVAVGLALLVGNVVAIVGALALLVSLELQVRIVEEPYLLSTHGDAYRRYAARVGRFVPGIGRLRTAAPGRVTG